MSDDRPADEVFQLKEALGLRASALIALGTLFLLGLVACFVLLSMRARNPGADFLPGMIGGASVIGIGLIARGLFLLRSTRRVVLDAEGLHAENFFGRRSVAWTDIDHIRRDKQAPMLGGDSVAVVVVMGKAGKPLLTLADTVAEFERMAARIVARSSAAAGRLTFDASADEQRRVSGDVRKLRRVAWFFSVFTLLIGAMFVYGIYEEVQTRRYASEGVRAEARILRRWMARITPRLEYEFADPTGKTWSQDVMMIETPWALLEGKSTVAVEYLPSNPSWNRLVVGEDPGAKFSGTTLLVFGGGLLLCGALAVFTMLGFDLKISNGVNTLTRHGRPVKTWGGPASPPAEGD